MIVDHDLALTYRPAAGESVCSWCGESLKTRHAVPHEAHEGGSLAYCSARCAVARRACVRLVEALS